MIPYWDPPKLHLGPLTVELFGLFVAAGAILGLHLGQRHARKMGVPERPMLDATVWAIGVGLFTAHWVHLLFYHPEELARSPWQPLRFWDGSSSLGGAFGGVGAVLVYFRVKRVPKWDYADAFALGVAPGWAIARLGCFAVHDHPGVLSSFPLAVAFPMGARHDLGLYEALLLGGIGVLVHLLARRGKLPGQLIGVLALLYGAGRFALDFLRGEDLPRAYVDVRYAGLTPGQYLCFLLVAFGVYRLASAPKLSAPKA
ncbi:MAG: prolipoprotein diacylglyceryl transferase [Myxococcaceae bacterium]